MGKYRERAKHERACVVCGKVFEAGRPDARFCSPKCRKVESRKAGERRVIDYDGVKVVGPLIDPLFCKRRLKPGEHVWLAGRFDRHVLVSVGYSTREGCWQATVRRAGGEDYLVLPLDRVFTTRADALNMVT